MTDSVKDYLNEAARFPLLTTDQEIQLSRQVKRALELQATDGDRTKAELRQIKIGLRARDTLINSNLRLVIYIAKRYISRLRNGGLEFMDLVQEGALGLHRAAEMFDGSKGYKFSTYAYWWIRQSINRAIDTKERLIRVPQHALERAYKAVKFQREYHQQHGKNPTLQETAEALDITVAELRILLERNTPHRSLDELATDDGSPLIEMIAAERPDETISDEYAEQLQLVFFQLTPEERQALEMFYGLNGKEQRSYAAIGREQGVSRERIRQRCTVAQRKLAIRIRTAPSLTSQYDRLPA